MKVNRRKLEIAEARACMGRKEIIAAGFPRSTLLNIKVGKNVTPTTVGRLAEILGVDVLDLIEEE